MFIALAVASLCSDALLHLIPEACGAHSHGKKPDHNHADHSHEKDGERKEHDHKEEHSTVYLYRMTFVVMTIYICYALEFLSVHAMGGHGHSHAATVHYENGAATAGVDNGTTVAVPSEQRKLILGTPMIAWLVLIGDAVHNLADGLAIGAAFTDTSTGAIMTAIAVACHEVPHEIGDFVVLIDAGK